MKNRKIRVAIRCDMVNKADESQLNLSGTGWENVEITVEQLVEHVEKGFPFTHQFSGGHRKKENFLGADILVADIDDGMSIEDAFAHPFVKNYASLLYTTASHTEGRNRYRIIFLLDKRVNGAESYEAMYAKLMSIIPTDRNIKSCAQFFFGNTKTQVHWILKSIPDEKIYKMVGGGMEERIRASNPPSPAELTSDTLVKVKYKNLQLLSSLPERTSIHCPFKTHADKNPSAFVKINSEGTRGVECRSCGQSGWTENIQFREDAFGYFEKMVKEYANQENSHFQYRGFTNHDHELETSMARSNYHVTDSKLLLIEETIPGINLIKSPKGSGKTHALSKIVSSFKNSDFRDFIGLKDERVILIGHRQSLIRESAEKLGLECYLDTGAFDTKRASAEDEIYSSSQLTLKPQYYAVCLDSLHNRILLNQESYGVVIIDESEQVFSHFLSEQMKFPTSNFEVLSHLIRRAKYVFCLDADLDTITLAGVISCMRHSKVQERDSIRKETLQLKTISCHLNVYKPTERQLNLYVSRNHLLDDLRKSISGGKRCFVTSNNKKFIQGLFIAFSKTYGSKAFKLIVSGLGDDEKIGFFLKNIKTEILNYDAVWASPTIGTGIDITFPNNEAKIDCVYGFFDGGINTHFDIDQQLARVRDPGIVNVWISPKNARQSVSREVILQELLHSDQVNGLRYYLNASGAHSSPGEHPFSELLTQVVAVRRRSMNRLQHNFIEHKNKCGWLVVKVEGEEVAKHNGSIIGKAGAKQRRLAMIARLMSAENIGFKQMQAIKSLKDKHKPLTDEQKASWAKYNLKWFYGEDVTPELIVRDNDGKMKKQIKILEAMINPTLKYHHYKDVKRNLFLSMAYDGEFNLLLFQRAVFLREVFAAIGFYDLATFSFKPNATYGTANLGDFINLMQKYQEGFTQLFNKVVNDHLTQKPASQVRTLLMLAGLNQVQVKANKGGGSSVYKINPQIFQSLLNIIERRAQRAKTTDEQDELEEKAA
jgi:Origin of replication binding protein